MKRKLAFYIDTLNRGGTEKATLDLINSLDTEKYDITLIKFFPGGEYNRLVHKNIKNKTKYKIFRFFTWNRKLAHKAEWWGKIFFERIPGKIAHKYLIGSKYDVEIACGFYFPTLLISNAKKAKKISWVHMDYEIDKSIIGNFSKKEGQKFFGDMDRIVCVSQDCEKSFNRKFDMPEKTETIYNIVDDKNIVALAQKETINFHSEVPVLISIGRLTWQKGYDRLLEIHKDLIEQGEQHQLYIIGEGSQYEALLQFIHEHSLEKTAHLLGYKENPYPYIAAADAFVCSSRHESFSLVVAESLILETPVISTRCSGPMELLGGGEYGILTENSKEALAEGLKRIISDESLRINLKKKAQERKTFFSKENNLKKWEQLFDE